MRWGWVMTMDRGGARASREKSRDLSCTSLPSKRRKMCLASYSSLMAATMTWWPFTSGSSPSSAQRPADNGESNSQAGPSTIPQPPRVDRFQTMLKDEEAYQTLQYPTTDDVPGCMQLL